MLCFVVPSLRASSLISSFVPFLSFLSFFHLFQDQTQYVLPSLSSVGLHSIAQAVNAYDRSVLTSAQNSFTASLSASPQVLFLFCLFS
jgi:hypothetical protein